MHFILIIVSLLCKRLIPMIGESIIIKNINIIFIIINNGNIEKYSFLVFLFSSDINLDKARGSDILLKFISNINVGNISIYIPSPLVPIILAIIIFIIIPNIFVRKAPIIKIIVDLINLFFIINFMKKLYHYSFIYDNMYPVGYV